MHVTKRTRSQLALPDLILQLPLHRSPLKDARSALRNQEHHLPAMKPAITPESEDEILLSPSTLKRDGGGDGGERQYKRPRHDTRLSPLPVLSIQKLQDRADENVVISAPVTTNSVSRHLSATRKSRSSGQRSSYTRAQSVPSFASTPPVPHLDLRTISASPKKLRHGSVPPVSPRKSLPSELDVIMVSPPHTPPHNSSQPWLPSLPSLSNEDSVISPNKPLPTTPVNSFPRLAFSLENPMSPLTPLPPTPLPPRVIKFGSVPGGPIGSSHGSSLPELGKAKGKGSSLRETLFLARMKTPPPTLPQSLIPRPKTPSREHEVPSMPVPGPSTAPIRPLVSPSKIPTATSSFGPRSHIKYLPAPSSPVKQSSIKSKTKPKPSVAVGGGRVTRSVSLRERMLKEGIVVNDRRKSALGAGFAAPTSNSTAKFTHASPSKIVAGTSGASSSGALSPVKAKLVPSSHLFSTTVNATEGTKSMAGRAGPSSLSNLSIALEKLNLPPPERPGMARSQTSMGFNRDGNGHATDDEEDAGKNVSGVGIGRPSGSHLGRSRTLHERAFSGPPGGSSSSIVMPSFSTTSTVPKAPFKSKAVGIQRYFAPIASGSGGSGGKINVNSGIVVGGMKGRFAFGGMGTKMGARIGDRASQRTSLPSVADTPVEGGGDETKMLNEGIRTEEDITKGDVSVGGANDEVEEQAKGKGEEKLKADAWRNNASRRASMASQALSQSLSSLPGFPQPQTPQPKVGTMGPPGVVTRAASSSYPLSSSPRKGAGKGKGKEGGEIMLKVLKNCTIFVDVRTDEGDDAGSLFVDMLRGMGAKILQRVGQTCTHIVFKNGLMSTLTRYRLMSEPRPKVVGIAWVVECVEQRALVEETKFTIDLEDMNVGGTNKRRRSMLPKTIPVDSYLPRSVTSPMSTSSPEAGDESLKANQSVDGSSSSIILDDDGDLPPLEKARRRRLGNMTTVPL